ncbi:MAG: alpha-glucosidase C-terminal domain-containing protein [Ignavibacteriae bacterium]|nr:alpha-glucosidase C-terminal domain-containing protein [Ignavibacteriota bacterium]
MTKEHSLHLLAKRLSAMKSKHRENSYAIPRLWYSGIKKLPQSKTVTVNPCVYFHEAIRTILHRPKQEIIATNGGVWTRHAVIYNMFIRTTCAFDHNQNGKLDLPVNADGWRETGSFLKSIALLPYIKGLGVNTIHLLPITSIGSDGKKGTLGSPYAIKNPYELDPNLSEPNLGLGSEEEFKAFVEAAHHLGIRVVVEFVFRTVAKDSDWVKEHPDWFYWVREDVKDRKPHDRDEHHYGAPIFTRDELRRIVKQVESGNLENLIPPHEVYRSMFTAPPPKESVHDEQGKYIGVLPDGTKVRISSAFADWPPDDVQPPWSDVTYLKMYNHPEFNYIAYNTVRMYDSRLATKEHVNRSLWEKLAGILPHYQQTFGIDGVMIDMGHSLPMELKQEIISRSREIDPDFAFWDENFSVTEQSANEGYNAVIGYQWCDQHHPEKFKNMLKRFSTDGFPLPFFATPESHNTPRAAAREGGITYSQYTWAMSNLIPAIPFIHSGFELGETYPINTGLDFTKEQLMHYPPEKLPLFSKHAYDWTHDNEITEWVKKISLIRAKYRELIVNVSPETFTWIETNSQDTIAFIRSSKQQRFLIAANANMNEKREISIAIESRSLSLIDILSGAGFPLKQKKLVGELAPGQVVVFEL